MLLRLNEYFTRTTLAVALVAVIGLLIATTTNLRSKLSTVRSELVSAQITNTIVQQEKRRLDSLIRVYGHSIDSRDSLIAVQGKQIQSQTASIVALENNLHNLQAGMSKITADSSYAYMMRRVPTTSEKKYGFDSTQVKDIHYTYVAKDQLENLNLKNSLLIGDLLRNSKTKDDQITDLKSLNSIYLSKEAILRKERDADKVAIESLNKNIKQQRRQKNWIVGGVAGAATLIIINSISK